jgi:citrate synthase
MPALAGAHGIMTTNALPRPVHTNVDLALAVLTAASGMHASASEAPVRGTATSPLQPLS